MRSGIIAKVSLIAPLLGVFLLACGSTSEPPSEATETPGASAAVTTSAETPAATSAPSQPTAEPRVTIAIAHVEQLALGSIQGPPPSVIPHRFVIEGAIDPPLSPPTLLEAVSISPAFAGKPDGKPHGVRIESIGSGEFFIYFSPAEPAGEYTLTLNLEGSDLSVTFQHAVAAAAQGPSPPQPTATAVSAVTPPPTAGAAAACIISDPGFTLTFDQRLEPGSVTGPPPTFVPYRFNVSGATLTSTDNMSVRTCPSYAENTPFGVRPGNVFLLYFPPGVAGGSYTVEVTLPGNLKASATIVHTP